MTTYQRYISALLTSFTTVKNTSLASRLSTVTRPDSYQRLFTIGLMMGRPHVYEMIICSTLYLVY